jgi:hypothetical protein
VPASRRLYLVILLIVALAAAAGAYASYRAYAARKAAECETPAPPPKPTTPPPKLPDFALETGCAPGEAATQGGAPKKSAGAVPKKK